MNPRILVPKVMGIGWTLNLGALAVRLGGLRPDDVDDDTVEQLPAGSALASLGVLGAVAAAALGMAFLAPHDVAYPQHWGPSGRPDAWSGWMVALLLPAAAAAVGVALAAIPTLLRRDVVERLMAQAFAALPVCAFSSIPVLAWVGRHGEPVGGLVLVGIAAGVGIGTATLVIPFRAAVRRAAAKENSWTR